MASTPRDPLLRLDDPELEWKRYERFCLDFARALPDVTDAHLYGTRGEDQQGIDIHADLVDGRVRTIQCRRVAKFGKGDAETTIAETTYEADEHVVWATCGLSTHARRVIRDTSGWDAWDIEQLSSQVRSLPREVARWLVEDHLGSSERRRLLGPESDLCVVPARMWFASSDHRAGLLGTHQELRGRDGALETLRTAVENPGVRVIVLIGRGGIGKTRLLRALADAMPNRRMMLLLEGVETRGVMDELPLAQFDLVVDDAHRRADLRPVLASVLRRDELGTIVLASRPQRLAALRVDLIELGVAADSVRELQPLGELEPEAAEALAQEELGDEHAELARPLADLTRDAPAVCVLGARLLRRGEMAPAALATHESVRRDILARFRDESLGRVNDSVDPALAARLLTLVAALQPVDVSADGTVAWLAEQAAASAGDVRGALSALENVDLLVGTTARRRVAPDILADQLLHEMCVDGQGQPTGRADALVAAAPDAALGRLLLNLAELDWRLGVAGEPRVLDGVCAYLRRRLLDADAWERQRLLEPLVDSAVYLAPWVVATARDLLDHPAPDAPLGLDTVVDDADARRHLVPLLRHAGLDPACTEAAMRLLWEIGADLVPRSGLSGEDALDALRKLGDYQNPIRYPTTLLSVVEGLLDDPKEAAQRRVVPVALLSGLIRREGTTARQRGYQVELGSYFVDAEATAELRTRLRERVVRSCREGEPRVRVASAELLGDMLRQPHGYYGRPVPAGAIAQWGDEQRALVADIDGLLGVTDDPLVARRLRDALEWHADHSAIRGIKTRARAVLRSRPRTEDELLVRALTASLARFADSRVLTRRRRALARALLTGASAPEEVLDRIDAMMTRLATCEPGVHRDCGALLAELAKTDPDWALAACRQLIPAPDRPTAGGVGVLLTALLGSRDAEARSVVEELAEGDVGLRRLAADHVCRMAWASDPEAPERELAVRLAADDDAAVVRGVLLTALRSADAEPDLARRIVLAVEGLHNPYVAEDLCMVLRHGLELSREQWELVVGRLLECPEVGYWYAETIGTAATAQPELTVTHLLARCDQSPDDWTYRALPFEGLPDVLQGAPELRGPTLADIAARLAAGPGGRRSTELPSLFWSLAGGGDEAFTTIATALNAGADQRTAGELLLDDAPAGRILARPEWVSSQLNAAPTGAALDGVRGSLYGALRSGVRQGVPGQPYPEDVRLVSRARELLDASVPGSRAAQFWSDLAASVEADMQREVERDRQLEEE